MVLATRQSLFTFLVLFSYCPCDNAINNNQENNGNEEESYKKGRKKSFVCFHVVECRFLTQEVRFIFVGDQFEAVEMWCVDGDGDKPRA